jgi:hypothetical protein
MTDEVDPPVSGAGRRHAHAILLVGRAGLGLVGRSGKMAQATGELLFFYFLSPIFKFQTKFNFYV